MTLDKPAEARALFVQQATMVENAKSEIDKTVIEIWDEYFEADDKKEMASLGKAIAAHKKQKRTEAWRQFQRGRLRFGGRKGKGGGKGTGRGKGAVAKAPAVAPAAVPAPAAAKAPAPAKAAGGGGGAHGPAMHHASDFEVRFCGTCGLEIGKARREPHHPVAPKWLIHVCTAPGFYGSNVNPHRSLRVESAIGAGAANLEEGAREWCNEYIDKLKSCGCVP